MDEKSFKIIVKPYFTVHFSLRDYHNDWTHHENLQAKNSCCRWIPSCERRVRSATFIDERLSSKIIFTIQWILWRLSSWALRHRWAPARPYQDIASRQLYVHMEQTWKESVQIRHHGPYLVTLTVDCISCYISRCFYRMASSSDRYFCSDLVHCVPLLANSITITLTYW
jgi:hypothetical protein